MQATVDILSIAFYSSLPSPRVVVPLTTSQLLRGSELDAEASSRHHYFQGLELDAQVSSRHHYFQGLELDAQVSSRHHYFQGLELDAQVSSRHYYFQGLQLDAEASSRQNYFQGLQLDAEVSSRHHYRQGLELDAQVSSRHHYFQGLELDAEASSRHHYCQGLELDAEASSRQIYFQGLELDAQTSSRHHYFQGAQPSLLPAMTGQWLAVLSLQVQPLELLRLPPALGLLTTDVEWRLTQWADDGCRVHGVLCHFTFAITAGYGSNGLALVAVSACLVMVEVVDGRDVVDVHNGVVKVQRVLPGQGCCQVVARVVLAGVGRRVVRYHGALEFVQHRTHHRRHVVLRHTDTIKIQIQIKISCLSGPCAVIAGPQ
jgi:hypothetical protein